MSNCGQEAETGSEGQSSFNYDVPGIVPELQQPSDMTCWATAATMLVSWHNNASYAIQSVTDMAGSTFREKFDNNQGLLGSEKEPFMTGLGLRSEPPMCYNVDGFLSLLKAYGPLWVTTDEDPTENFSIHARVAVGMSSDGSANNTTIRIIDPADGNTHSEAYDVFMKKFEEVAIGDLSGGRPFRIQIIHY